MGENVVKLGADSPFAAVQEHMSDEDFGEFTKLASHHAVIGHVVFDDRADVIASENVDEAYVAAFANAFDICDALTEEVGQKTHVGTLFESRKLEITCRRYGEMRAVILQGKGAKKGVA